MSRRWRFKQLSISLLIALFHLGLVSAEESKRPGQGIEPGNRGTSMPPPRHPLDFATVSEDGSAEVVPAPERLGSPTREFISSGPLVNLPGFGFCSTPALAIPDDTPAGDSDSLFIAPALTINDLDVEIIATHTWVGDLIFELEHDSTATSAIIYDRPGVPASTFGCNGNDIAVRLDDEAGAPVEDECGAGVPAIAGRLVPNNPLSAFDGESTNGSWTLTVSDNAGGDTGTLDEWCLVQDDESVLQNTSLAMGTLGFGAQVAAGNRVADDFTVGSGGSTERFVGFIDFFAYQTGSTTDSTFTAANLQIWDGPPDSLTSNIVFGDTTTNRLASTSFSGIFRTSETTLGGRLRPIMRNRVWVGMELAAGTYWLDVQFDGSLPSGPWVPPVTIPGQTTTGNALQFTGSWFPMNDNDTGTQQGVPFELDVGIFADGFESGDVSAWSSSVP